MVATVIGTKKSIRMGRISHQFIEIQDGVEMPVRTNPLINLLTIGFAPGTWMIVLGSHIGCEGCTNDLDSIGMGTVDDLPVRA